MKPAYAWRRSLSATAAVLLLATGAAACGGEDKTAASDSPSASTGGDDGAPQDTSTSDQQADDGVKYAACMRKNGIDVADPAPGENPQLPEGVAQSLLKKAEKECGEPAGSQQAGSGGLAGDPKLEELALADQKCLRENGYEMPEKKEGEVTPALPGENPVFDRAKAACKKTGDALKDYLDKKLGAK
ncbi:hypothetical protein [Streptomyces albidochromogenes]|uniref:Lipoprotein n=1 Tax=Streptomyces albidochromogenes TaxID=329524 RepID=A0ABW6FI45_9ACTN